MGVSSLHMTFNTEQEWQTLAKVGFLKRNGIQYHWQNNGYSTFDDFLMDMKQSKRKNIRQVSSSPTALASSHEIDAMMLETLILHLCITHRSIISCRSANMFTTQASRSSGSLVTL